jgi:hypothetical protein
MTKKQEIYLELLRMTLPHIRGTLSRSVIWGKPRHEAYELSELVHNIYTSILDEEFVAHDIWILNVQAKSYFDRAVGTTSYDGICALLCELFEAVPEGLRTQLEWNGPNQR